MNYLDGQTVMVGDQVRLGRDEGVVVFSIESDGYANGFSRAEWAYLERGIMVRFPALGLVHIEDQTPDLSLLARANSLTVK